MHFGGRSLRVDAPEKAIAADFDRAPFAIRFVHLQSVECQLQVDPRNSLQRLRTSFNECDAASACTV